MNVATKYSQQNEEIAIADIFPVGTGRFLDIGAWDPFTFSNTRALFDRGWTGVLIEPSPWPLIKLLEAYKGDSRMQIVSAAVAVSSDIQLARMHITDDALSTTEDVEYRKWKDTAKFHGTLIVPVLTVRDLIVNFGAFDFVNIDTEGTSVDIFKELLRLKQFPKCISVEFNNRKEEALGCGRYHGYELAHSNDANLIFQRKV